MGLAVFVSLLGFLAVTKGWLLFVFIPLLVLVVPFIYATQIWTYLRVRTRPNRTLRTLARVQIATLLVAYLCAPGAYDTNEMILFGVIHMEQNSLLITVGSLLTLVALAAFIVVTVWQLITLFRTRVKRPVDTSLKQ